MTLHNTGKVGYKIQRRRNELNMSLSELARRSGISRGHLHAIESGESSLTEEKLQSVANALGLLVSQLIGEIGDLSELPMDIPDSLREFADQDNLTSADVMMLSRINYRGKKPQTLNEWRVLFTVIRGTLDKD